MTQPTTHDLELQLGDLRPRYEAALEQAHEAREARNRIAGERVLGERDEEELGEAHKAVLDAESVAASLASAITVLEGRLQTAEQEEQARKIDALARRGSKAAAARESSVLDLRESLVAAAEAIARFDAANEKAAVVRDEAVAEFDIAARLRDVDAEINVLADAAPEGQILHPVMADREYQRRAGDVRAAADLAADAAAIVVDDNALREAAGSLPVERLLPESVRQALGGGREFVKAPPPAKGMPMSTTVTTLYGSGELDEANGRYRDFQAALDALAADVPTLREARYGGQARGVTASAA